MTIPNLTMDRGVDDDGGNNCVDNENDLRATPPRFEVVTLDKRWYLLYGVRFLRSANGSESKMKEEDWLASHCWFFLIFVIGFVVPRFIRISNSVDKFHKLFLGAW